MILNYDYTVRNIIMEKIENKELLSKHLHEIEEAITIYMMFESMKECRTGMRNCNNVYHLSGGNMDFFENLFEGKEPDDAIDYATRDALLDRAKDNNLSEEDIVLINDALTFWELTILIVDCVLYLDEDRYNDVFRLKYRPEDDRPVAYKEPQSEEYKKLQEESEIQMKLIERHF